MPDCNIYTVIQIFAILIKTETHTDMDVVNLGNDNDTIYDINQNLRKRNSIKPTSCAQSFLTSRYGARYLKLPHIMTATQDT